MKSFIKKASLLAGYAIAVACLVFLIPASFQAQELRGKISDMV